MSELDELIKKYGEGVPVGLFLGRKKAEQALNKYYLDIIRQNLRLNELFDMPVVDLEKELSEREGGFDE